MNTTVIGGQEYALMPVGKSRFAIVDMDILPELIGRRWHYNSGYAVCLVRKKGEKRNATRMHRLIAKTPTGLMTDHINGNTLDNRRSNLRNVDAFGNNQNRPIQRRNKLGVKGVIFRRNRFTVNIKANGRDHYIGAFKAIEDARLAHNEAVVQLHGEFARLA